MAGPRSAFFNCGYSVTILRRDFWTIHGAEESSGVNSSPAGAAGQVVGRTQLLRVQKLHLCMHGHMDATVASQHVWLSAGILFHAAVQSNKFRWHIQSSVQYFQLKINVTNQQFRLHCHAHDEVWWIFEEIGLLRGSVIFQANIFTIFRSAFLKYCIFTKKYFL